MELADQVALITGAGGGIGAATAIEFARRGANVVIGYRSSKCDAERTAKECRQFGRRALCIPIDVTRDAQCRQAIESVDLAFGRLGVLVNNAGMTNPCSHEDLEGLTEEDWLETFNVNVVGAFRSSRAAVPLLRRSGGGEIVMVSSIAGIRGLGSSLPYCASKAALNNLTMTLAKALAPEIRVNAVAPGFVTGRWHKRHRGQHAYEQMKVNLTQRVPLKQLCQPADVARVIVGLVGGPDLVTGHVLPVDSGRMLSS